MLTMAMRRKKRVLTFLLIAVLMLACLIALLYSPLMNYSISGLENFNPNDCSLSLCQHLFPSDDFPKEYEYFWGDYQYHYFANWPDVSAEAFSVLEYSPENYAEAKEYCVRQFESCDEHQFTVGEYTFIEHLCHSYDNGPECRYPGIFNMYAFNDEKCRLVFLGYCNFDSDSPELQLGERDFASFIESAFSEYYDFYS